MDYINRQREKKSYFSLVCAYIHSHDSNENDWVLGAQIVFMQWTNKQKTHIFIQVSFDDKKQPKRRKSEKKEEWDRFLFLNKFNICILYVYMKWSQRKNSF